VLIIVVLTEIYIIKQLFLVYACFWLFFYLRSTIILSQNRSSPEANNLKVIIFV